MAEKFYNAEELKKIADECRYKFARLVDKVGEPLMNWSRTTERLHIDKQIDNIFKRLSSSITPDGAYIIQFTNVFSNKKLNSFFVLKGDAPSEVPQLPTIESEKKETTYKAQSMTTEEAIKLITENAELKAQVRMLEMQLESAYEELSEAYEGLNEKPDNANIGGFLSENKEILLSIVDRTLSLGEAKVQKQQPQIKYVPVEIGSPLHIKIIEQAIANEDLEKMNAELMKISNVNPILFQELVKKYELEPINDESENQS